MNAWPEGARNPRYPVVDWDNPAAEKIEYTTVSPGFDCFGPAHTEKYPLLARALKDKQQAHAAKIEWLLDKIVDGEQFRTIDFNWCQIQRVVHSIGDDEVEVRDAAFDELCGQIESVLWDGKRSEPYRYGEPIDFLSPRLCGGVRDLLGREPNGADTISLRPLREPFWRVTRYPEELGGETLGEWIVEYSLQAIAQHE